MADRPRAREMLNDAIGNVGMKMHPAWWFDAAYYSEIRDIAGLIGIAAEIGDDKTAADLIGRLNQLSAPEDQLNTQDKTALLSAVHALNTGNVPRVIKVNGVPLPDPKLPLELAPDTVQIARGYTVVNAGDRPIWRTLSVTGAPAMAPPPLHRGYTLTKSYMTLDGKPLDPAHVRQNDRLIVVLSGSIDDPNQHRSVAIDLLPAGWEIEGTIEPAADTSDSDDNEGGSDSAGDKNKPAPNVAYPFLQPVSTLKMAEARDDRLVAAFDLNESGSEHLVRDKNDKAATLAPGSFKIAYVVRVVTPGRFDLPEAVVEDMYRPGLMARTAAGQTEAAAR